MTSDADYRTHFAEECGILVVENCVKMGIVQPEPGRFAFEGGDLMAEFCQANAMPMRGHTLVWHIEQWPWLASTVTAANARQHLEKHIRAVAGRYRGRMHSWDVVNEAVFVEDGREDGLRDTPFLQMIGPDYVEFAFRVAHEADPDALLCYNDYDLVYDTPEHGRKRTAVLHLLCQLKDRDTPIHALGIQAHLDWANRKDFHAETLQSFLREVASLDLRIIISELDVSDRYLPDDIRVRDEGVAATYETFLTAALVEPAVVAVVTWGLTDKYTWISSAYPRPSGEAVRVLPLDCEYRRKPAWHAMARAFDSRKA